MEGGGIDLEYGSPIGNSSNGLSLGSHFSIGQHSFSQMQVCFLNENCFSFGKFICCFFFFVVVLQGDLDRQRLLGDRPRAGVYESVIEDGLEGIEHQER